MRQALSFNESQYHFDVDDLKQFSLMDTLNYTYLCILLQRARFSAVKAGQRLNSAYETESIVFLIKGHAIVKCANDEQYIAEGYRAPIFHNQCQGEVVFTDDSFLVRIERPLYEIFNKSTAFNKVFADT